MAITAGTKDEVRIKLKTNQLDDKKKRLPSFYNRLRAVFLACINSTASRSVHLAMVNGLQH